MTDVLVTWLRHRLGAVGPTWLEKAHTKAAEVQAYHAQRGTKDAHGFEGGPGKGLTITQDGFAAEVAVSLYTGLRWNLVVGEFGKPDVGADVEVKNRERKYSTFLVIAEGEARRDRRYVITYGRDPELYLAGWCYGEHVLDLPVKVFSATQTPGYAAPADWLLGMDTFPEVSRFRRGEAVR